jgi:hypothetical protein
MDVKLISPPEGITEIEGEEFYLLGYNAAQSVESQQTFRTNIVPPSSEFLMCFMLVSRLLYSSTLKMEEKCSSETLVGFQRNITQKM